MPPIHTELTFEEAIEDSLLSAGHYTKGDPDAFDAPLGLFPSALIAFLKDTQPEALAKLAKLHGSGT